MQTRYSLTLDGLNAVVVSAFEANGHSATDVQFIGPDGAPVQIARVEVLSDAATLTVRYTPENTLEDIIRQRNEYLMRSLFSPEAEIASEGE